MSILVFPDNPVDGQIYPPESIPGVNQYIWRAISSTWDIYVQSVFDIIDAKGDLIVGLSDDVPNRLPVGNDGDILVADSAETLGVKWEAPVPYIPESIIQAKGDLIVGQSAATPDILPADTDGYVLTLDSNETLGVKWAPSSSSPAAVQTVCFTSQSLAPGQSEDFWIDDGSFLSLISVGVTASSEDAWVRVYTSEAGMNADTRILPGPPFPSPSTGFASEVVTSPSEPTVVILPAPSIYSENGLFFKLTNQSGVTQTIEMCVKYFVFVPSPCDIPPYYCNPYVNPYCVTDFSYYPDGSLDGITPSLVYSGGTTILPEANNYYYDYVTGGNGSLGEFYVERGPAGEIIEVDIYGGSGYQVGNTITIPGSLIGGTNGVDDITITLSAVNGMGFGGAWEGCASITKFPSINVESGIDFSTAWQSCYNMTSFPALNSGLGLDFSYSWAGCSSLADFGQVDTNNGEDFTSSWAYCSSLTTFPALDFSSALDLTNAWVGCSGLTAFPTTLFPQAEIFSGTWSFCTGLLTFPTIVAPLGTNFSFAWAYCFGLTSFPSLTLSSGLNFNRSWFYCTGLTSFPGTIDVSSGTTFESAWQNCTGLTSFPGNLNVSSGQNFMSAWQDCSGLTSFPGTLDFSSGTTFLRAWYGCSGLTSFPGTLDFSSGTNFYGAWFGCSGLTSFPSTLDFSSGTNFGLAWEGCSGLTSFPGNLNFSSGTDFRAAWADCTGLTSFPGTLDFGSGTVFRLTWSNCTGLTSFPNTVDVSAGTDFYGTWSFCTGLTSFPALSLSAGTVFTAAWRNCTGLTSFPANMFDTCSSNQFALAWLNCGLDQTSVDNILVSLDTGGQTNGVVDIYGGTSSSPGALGLAAKTSLQGKGWTVTTN